MTENVIGIGEVARRFGVSTQAVRLWELEGKVQPARTSGGQRRYTEADLAALERARSESKGNQK